MSGGDERIPFADYVLQDLKLNGAKYQFGTHRDSFEGKKAYYSTHMKEKIGGYLVCVNGYRLDFGWFGHVSLIRYMEDGLIVPIKLTKEQKSDFRMYHAYIKRERWHEQDIERGRIEERKRQAQWWP